MVRLGSNLKPVMLFFEASVTDIFKREIKAVLGSQIKDIVAQTIAASRHDNYVAAVVNGTSNTSDQNRQRNSAPENNSIDNPKEENPKYMSRNQEVREKFAKSRR